MEANKIYLANKLNPILEPMVAQILVVKPDDPVSFMLEYLQKKYHKSGKAVIHETKKEEVGSENESDPDEEDEAKEPEVKSEGPRISVSRKAISAEAYGDWNKKGDFKPPVIPKSEEQKAKIREKLKASFVFNALDAKELEPIVDAMGEKLFEPEGVVIKQGDEGDNLYVVESGKLGCYRQFAKDQPQKYLKEYQPGEAFGELALLYNAPRAATIIAKEKCVLWSLDRATFLNLVKDATIKKREKYEEFLKSVKILSTIEPYEMTKIMDAVKPMEYKAGTQIITEGEEGNIFFLLAAGAAVATKTLEKGKAPQKVMEYKKGDYFGELALIKNSPRAANVIASTDCLCLTLDRHSFKRLLGPLDDLLKRNTEIYDHYAKSI